MTSAISRMEFLKALVLGCGAAVVAGCSGERLVIRVSKTPSVNVGGSEKASTNKHEPVTHELETLEPLVEEGEKSHDPTSVHGLGVAQPVGPADALKRLVQGNQRFWSGKLQYPRCGVDRREELMAGQHPFAAVLTCSDSRVSPEIIFDQGLGDLFVVRTAGNVLSEIALGSLEYCVEHLSVPLLVVMGHQKCGAVTAACQVSETPGGGEGSQHGASSGHLSHVLNEITPTVEKARQLGGDLVSQAIDLHILEVMSKLQKAEPVIGNAVREGRLEVIGARYDLDTGMLIYL